MKNKMFKAVSMILAIITVLACFASCAGAPVEALVLNKSEITIKEEESFTLVCTVVPNDAVYNEISWISSDSSIATVDKNGNVKGIKTGECIVTATTGGKTVAANVTVKPKGPNFRMIYNSIDSSARSGWTVGADGSYMCADTNTYNIDDYGNWAVAESIEEVNEMLGLPDSLYNDMLQTNSLMGKQQETFESIGVKVSWTYHPNNGLEVTYKLIEN
ncbi:MAG: Ig-like domain-containing protein [Clostridia bacterium]|nr:Ig-like domain-containing protein [Clostridia bacterium]